MDNPEKPEERLQSGRTLADLRPGERAMICRIEGGSMLKRRLSAMGIVKGVAVTLAHTALLGDPRVYNVLGYDLSLRNEDACRIMVQTESE